MYEKEIFNDNKYQIIIEFFELKIKRLEAEKKELKERNDSLSYAVNNLLISNKQLSAENKIICKMFK